jgi:hypothetical protein
LAAGLGHHGDRHVLRLEAHDDQGLREAVEEAEAECDLGSLRVTEVFAQLGGVSRRERVRRRDDRVGESQRGAFGRRE